LIYVMLAGRFPFQGATRAELSRNVLRGTFTSPSGLSREPESLLRRVLVLDPNQRYTIEHVRVHPWMQVRHASNPGQQVRTPPLSAHLNGLYSAFLSAILRPL
jgi:serine/threonine protein kinase